MNQLINEKFFLVHKNRSSCRSLPLGNSPNSSTLRILFLRIKSRHIAYKIVHLSVYPLFMHKIQLCIKHRDNKSKRTARYSDQQRPIRICKVFFNALEQIFTNLSMSVLGYVSKI